MVLEDHMIKRKNRTTANGIIVKKGRLLWLISYYERYKVKVPNIERPLTLLVHRHYYEFKEWDTVSVEYDPENPKRCKLSKNYSY